MPNISEVIREARLRWLGHVERSRDANVIMRTWKWVRHRKKTKTEVERCYTKRYEGERSTERRGTRSENSENENLMRRPKGKGM